MANLQVKDIDEKLYQSLKELASREKRSISGEVVHIIQKYLSTPQAFRKNPTDEFLNLAGSWEDERDEVEIAEDIHKARKNSDRFRQDHELFD